MADTVFILGAGASKQAGVPLMGEFLDDAYDIWKLGKIQDSSKSFEDVFKGISSLQAAHSKARQLDINNVEAVFAAFEMAKTIGRFGSYNLESIENLISCMKIVITKTIEHRLKFKMVERRWKCPYPYENFAQLIKKITDKYRNRRAVSVITFNYDIAFDFSAHFNGIEIDYGLKNSPINRGALPFLKLHGSINWAKVKESDDVIAWNIGNYLTKASLPPFIEDGIQIPIGSQIANFEKVLGQPIMSEPVIVPPTWNKGEYHRRIQPVWNAAAKELSEAENIFIIGYSLPESDYFFRYLYALGTIGDTRIRRFRVYDPDPNGGVEARFRSLLGPGVIDRFEIEKVTFDAAIGSISNILL